MKAKEYAEKYKANPTNQMLMAIVKEMVQEIGEVAKMRNAMSNHSFRAIYNEQKDKWRAFVNLIGDSEIRPDGFDRFCEKFLPEVYAAVKAEPLKKR